MTEARERQGRMAEIGAERRRRSDDTIDAAQAHKMRVPREVEERLKAEGRTARWVNDVGSRMQDMTVRDDWDKVEGVDPRTVKVDIKTGETVKAILVSKRNDFIVEDRLKMDAVRRKTEQAMLTGRDPITNQQTLAPDRYADPANKIERDNRILE